MSRSRKHTPISPNCGTKSEAIDKKIWHKRFRRTNRIKVKHDQDPLHLKELSNPWDMSKDGRHWMVNPKLKDLIK